ncbi:DUF2865 domain-containing protein [Stappia sp. GBMRC 2046]|uniref:DUF2865 domain-containing protein n=1 Tax=Stappia sediminis TaxID=2692190 RepID=A0A7X3LXU9_9HYPH|nr:DUF2865 domain-containing protein [Stappia sediminis]MXN67100.1 DUF2865 domain-containing protein [Stappia sediminis]
MPDIRSIRARVAAVVITAGFGALLAPPAIAADCEVLEARLAALGRAASVHPEYAKWNAAATRQAMALRTAEHDALRYGCADGDLGSACEPMMTKIERMRANLEKMEALRDRYAGPSGENDTRRAALERQFERQGCIEEIASPWPSHEEDQSEAGFTSRREGDASLGISSRHRDGANRSRAAYARNNQPREEEQGLASARFGSGYYRTLCVRTCDGYYFPVSFRTTKYGFGRDEIICRSMCPAVETSLYVHLNPGESAEEMVSLEGIPYRKQENAFVFRNKFVEGCSCQGDPRRKEAIASLIRSGDIQARPNANTQSFEPDTLVSGMENRLPAPVIPDGADPDTAMNIRLGFAPEASSPSVSKLGDSRKEEPKPVIAKPADPGKSNVRIVGPRYYVAQ